MIFKANATLNYSQTTSEIVGESPITGEPIFSETTNTESISVSIEKSAIQPTVEDLPGRDRTTQFYSGRLISPDRLPYWYTPGTELDLVWNNGNSAKFYVYPANISRLGLDGFFGQPIEGVVSI